jgi:hypothetical protein
LPLVGALSRRPDRDYTHPAGGRRPRPGDRGRTGRTPPVAGFQRLYDLYGTAWTSDVEAFLRFRDRPGSGYVAKRVASTLPGNWRTRLTEAQQSELHRVLSLLPVLTGGEYGER